MRTKLGAFLSLALTALASSAASAQSRDSTIVPRVDSTSPVDEVLRSFLISHLERIDPEEQDADSSWDAKVVYAIDSVSLAGSGPRADLVYVVAPLDWCGSGGCTTLVIDRNAATPRIVAEISLTWLPIRVLPTTSHGWHDLGLVVGGGAETWDTYRYNGRRYRLYRSVPLSAADSAAGQAVLPRGTPEHPLYRCRRHLVGDERRDCGLPKAGSGDHRGLPSVGRGDIASREKRQRTQPAWAVEASSTFSHRSATSAKQESGADARFLSEMRRGHARLVS